MTKENTAKEFWKNKTLEEMTSTEWESLCDGCGKCCLEKLQDSDTGEILYTNIACRLLNIDCARCSDYSNRQKLVDDCIKLTPKKVRTIKWLPATCSYRLVLEKKDLPDWHHLVCGDRDMVHKKNMSVKNRAVPSVLAEEDYSKHIIDWI